MHSTPMARLIHLAALLLTLPAWAADAPLFGTPDCRVTATEADAGDEVRWKGPCKDGHAEGDGVLTLRRDGRELSRYEGPMVHGVRQGQAYVKYANGDQYEGDYANDKREGKGVYLAGNGSEYQGQWKAGKADGIGSQTYATGGRYDGAWQAGVFHGRGKATYIGGQVVEGKFRDGKPVGASADAPAPDGSSYRLLQENPNRHSLLERRDIGSVVGVPYDKGFADLTPAQQQTVRLRYPLLHDGDVPPYPLKGPRNASEWVYKAREVSNNARGVLSLLVTVGSDGKASAVKVVSSPDPDLSKAAILIMMNEKFSPGTCAGKPCEMIYPVGYQLM
ncbi:MAG TPA: energy transducer TonB [Telluria sp.]|nr:energy transducer TonB [Telluria sp.]